MFTVSVPPAILFLFLVKLLLRSIPVKHLMPEAAKNSGFPDYLN